MKKIPLLFALMMFISPSNSWAMWHDFEEDLPSSRSIAPQLSPQPDDELQPDNELRQAFLQSLTFMKKDLISFCKNPFTALVNGFCRSFFQNQELTMFITFSGLASVGHAGACWYYDDNSQKWPVNYYMNESITNAGIAKCSRAAGVPFDSEGSFLTRFSNAKPCPIPTSSVGYPACWSYNENTQKWSPKYPVSGSLSAGAIEKCSLASGTPVDSQGSFITRLAKEHPCH